MRNSIKAGLVAAAVPIALMAPAVASAATDAPADCVTQADHNSWVKKVAWYTAEEVKHKSNLSAAQGILNDTISKRDAAQVVVNTANTAKSAAAAEANAANLALKDAQAAFAASPKDAALKAVRDAAQVRVTAAKTANEKAAEVVKDAAVVRDAAQAAVNEKKLPIAGLQTKVNNIAKYIQTSRDNAAKEVCQGPRTDNSQPGSGSGSQTGGGSNVAVPAGVGVTTPVAKATSAKPSAAQGAKSGTTVVKAAEQKKLASTGAGDYLAWFALAGAASVAAGVGLTRRGRHAA